MRFALLLACVVATALLATSAAPAAPPAVFGTAAPCTPGTGGTTVCSGIVTVADGSPIDVNVGLPAGAQPAAGYPLVMMFHGWGGSKASVTTGEGKHWLDEGYAVFSMSDRGWGNSCGGQDSKRFTPACAKGYNHLMDSRIEVGDAQELAGRLVDEGIADPDAIGATGPSYGGGMSMALAALKDRQMKPDGTLKPWTSPQGEPISLAAAAPEIPWTDLAYSLAPNGRTLDYVADAPYLGPDGDAPIGILKQSFVAGLYGTGQATSNYAVPGSDPDADLTKWYGLVNAGEPYDDNPEAADLIDELTSHHSSYYIASKTDAPAPLLISNGWTDDLFPPDEAIRFYNKTRDEHPGADVSLYFLDYGHQRGQNKAADTDALNAVQDAWFDYYLKGEGAKPANNVKALTTTCPKAAASAGPFTAPTWKAMAPGEIRYTSDPAQLISPEAGNPQASQAFDPIAGGGACATADATDQPGVANYRLPAAPAGGYTLMGSPTIIADVLSPGPHSQLAMRLLDVDPGTGQETLVARGLYRPGMTPEAERRVFQLHPDGYEFAAGHIPKLELLPSDSPYARKTNGQAPVTISNLELRLPVLESPGQQGAVAPAPRFLPDGYEFAPGYSAGPTDTDGDGVPDSTDACPNQPGPSSNNGCPAPATDTDGDGTPDSSDACPNQPGPASNNGCPANTDNDGDGIPNADDDCPNAAGPASNNGCPVAEPDADGDGVPDGSDSCPDVAGPRGNFGCPRDADNDGTPNADDDCPGKPGPKGNNGCPRANNPPPKPCSEKITGTRKADRLIGTGAGERIRGRGGSDKIKSKGGVDCVNGGAGRDRIMDNAGKDKLNGRRGRDRIRAVDGERDKVNCGKGRDTALVDKKDQVSSNCETIGIALPSQPN